MQPELIAAIAGLSSVITAMALAYNKLMLDRVKEVKEESKSKDEIIKSQSELLNTVISQTSKILAIEESGLASLNRIDKKLNTHISEFRDFRDLHKDLRGGGREV